MTKRIANAHSVLKPYRPRMADGEEAVPRLRDLRAFAVVSATRHLGRAAAELRVAQPALTRQMQALERSFGMRLLDRHAKGVALTPAGEVLLRGARESLAALDASIAHARAAAAGQVGRVVLGAGAVAMLRGVPTDAQLLVAERHPGIELAVRETDPVDIAAELESGQLDLCLSTRTVDDNRFIATPLWEEVVDHAVLPAGHPLARRRAVAVGELAGLPLLVPDRVARCTATQLLLGALRDAGSRSPVERIVGGVHSAHLSVAAGLGWYVASRAFAGVPGPGTAIVPLTDLRVPIGVFLFSRRDEARPAVRVLHDLIRRLATIPRDAVAPSGDDEAVEDPLPDRPRADAVELRHLRALMAVAVEGSIGRAAGQLALSQPAVSRHLAQLEFAVGTALLTRATRGIALTAAGRALVTEAPEVIRAVHRAARTTARLGNASRTRCALAAVPSPAVSAILAPILPLTRAHRPPIELQIREMASPWQPEALLRGEIDLGIAHAFGAGPADDRVARHRLRDDRIVGALLRTSHPLAARERLRPEDLADVPFLFMRREYHPPFHDRVMHALAEIGLRPRVDFTHDGITAVWTLAAQGRGWALGAWSQLQHPPVGLTCVPIAGLSVPWGLDLLMRHDETADAVRAVAGLLISPERSGEHAAVPSRRAG